MLQSRILLINRGEQRLDTLTDQYLLEESFVLRIDQKVQISMTCQAQFQSGIALPMTIPNASLIQCVKETHSRLDAIVTRLNYRWNCIGFGMHHFRIKIQNNILAKNHTWQDSLPRFFSTWVSIQPCSGCDQVYHVKFLNKLAHIRRAVQLPRSCKHG